MTATTDLDQFCLDSGATVEEVLELSEVELENALDMLRHVTLAKATGSTIEEVLGLSEDETKTALEAFPTVAMPDKEKVISQWRERQGESKNKQILETTLDTTVESLDLDSVDENTPKQQESSGPKAFFPFIPSDCLLFCPQFVSNDKSGPSKDIFVQTPEMQ